MFAGIAGRDRSRPREATHRVCSALVPTVAGAEALAARVQVGNHPWDGPELPRASENGLWEQTSWRSRAQLSQTAYLLTREAGCRWS